MALLSRATPLGSDVGLSVLLAAGSSSVLVRCANVAIGVGLPVYQSIKALEDRVHPHQRKWLGYWTVYGCIHAAETACSALIPWVPFYEHAKLGLLIWLQLPPDYGFVRIYCGVLRPLFHEYRRHVDPFLHSLFRHLGSWERAHRPQLQSAAHYAGQALGYAKRTVRRGVDAIQRSQRVAAEAPEPSPFAEEDAATAAVPAAASSQQQQQRRPAEGAPGTWAMGPDSASTGSAGSEVSGGVDAAGAGQPSSQGTGPGAPDPAGWVHVGLGPPANR